jgi:hypothetical protein
MEARFSIIIIIIIIAMQPFVGPWSLFQFGSVVGISAGYGLDDRGVLVRVPTG